MPSKIHFAAFAVVASIAGSSAMAVDIVDPTFDVNPTAAVAGVDNTEVGAWYRNGPPESEFNEPRDQGGDIQWYRSTDPNLVDASGVAGGSVARYNTLPGAGNNASTRGLIQVVTDTSADTGAHELTFDYLLHDIGGTNPLILRAEVFGINTASWSGAFDLAVGNPSGTTAADDSYDPTQVTQLLDTVDFTVSTGATITVDDWSTATFAVDLGTGYEQLAIRFTATDGGAGQSNSDTIAVDNVALTAVSAVPEPTSMAVLGLAGLGFLRRRRA